MSPRETAKEQLARRNEQHRILIQTAALVAPAIYAAAVVDVARHQDTDIGFVAQQAVRLAQAIIVESMRRDGGLPKIAPK